MHADTHPLPRRSHSLPLIGAQLSSAGGWGQVTERALSTGAEVVQLFSSNPRIWPTAPPEIEALAELAASLQQLGLPLFMHAVYLVNPASPEEMLRARSAAALTHALLTGALAAASGVVTHLGSHRGEGFDTAAPLVAQTLRLALAEAERGLEALSREAGHPPVVPPPLLLETSAGSGATVGGTLDELAALLDLLPASPDDSGQRFGLCLDTAHMFAAGWPIHEAEGLTTLVDELRSRDLLRRVGLIHLNDSASLFASKRDRHANPGEGELGYAALARVVALPALANVPFVLEVPGQDGHGPGPAEIAAVKKMRLQVAG